MKKPIKPPGPSRTQALRDEVRRTGNALSNVAHNLAHGWELNDTTRTRCCQAVREWDAAVSAARAGKAL